MKKAVILMMALLMALNTFAACSPKKESPVNAATPEPQASVAPASDVTSDPVESPGSAAPIASPTTNAIGRHPLYQAADKLKEAFLKLGFQLIDNGEGAEIEASDVTFVTWEELQELFGWQNDPVLLEEGAFMLRTRILPAHLRAMTQAPPIRILTYGRVYQNNAEYPMRHQIEGFVVEKGLDIGAWKELWQLHAIALFGSEATVSFEPFGAESHKISVQNPADGQVFELGYTGPASAQALEVCGVGEKYPGWVFILDVEQFALQLFGLTDPAPFYENDVAFLSQFNSEAPTVGYNPEYKPIDILRELGYYEVCGDVIYPDGVYKKMNMIQESWDTNNQPIPLKQPLGDLTALRTVMSPACEDILGSNYAKGNETARIFEVSHIYKPVADRTKSQLPAHEMLNLTITCYGGGVTRESFIQDMETLLTSLGVNGYAFYPTNIAIAYEGDCLIIMEGANMLGGNFGQISAIATKNYGIGDPAFMANIELEVPMLTAMGE